MRTCPDHLGKCHQKMNGRLNFARSEFVMKKVGQGVNEGRQESGLVGESRLAGTFQIFQSREGGVFWLEAGCE